MIELNSPNISKEEIKLTLEALKSGWVSEGKYLRLFENKFKKYIKSKYAVSCVNGSSALHLALKVIKANKDTEVLVPSVSFIATANSVIYNNASPVFLGVNKYLNLDEESLINFIKHNTYKKNGKLFNKKTKKRIIALTVVHVFGNCANLNLLKKICKKNNIYLIEDAAESLGSFYINKKKKIHSGTLGDIGCFSFNANKIITTGGGGMIVTNNKNLSEKARFLANQAKKNSIYFDHTEIGYNYRLPNVNCAIGCAQIGKINKFKKLKIRNFKLYKKYFDKNIEVLNAPIYSDSNYWLCCIKLRSKKNVVKKSIDFLKKKGIKARPVWKLLPFQKQFSAFQKFDVKNSRKFINNTLCIPSSTSLKRKEIKKIALNINLLAKKINKNEKKN